MPALGKKGSFAGLVASACAAPIKARRATTARLSRVERKNRSYGEGEREKRKGRLGEYERKRDFGKTAEPAPKRRRRKKSAPRFVVQEHSARRLHWDLRLEHDGVAASWAIPNGIPEDPSENRKAVHTEDHPLEYLELGGGDPGGRVRRRDDEDLGPRHLRAGEVGAGKVMVEFHGERLRGRYALFRAGKARRTG